MSEQNKLFEIFCQFSKDKRNNIFENSEYYMELLGEAAMNSIYKGTVFLADDDKKFLSQFEPKHWKRALFLRYDQYLWEHLKKLHDAREESYKKYFEQYFRREYENIKSDPLYSKMSEDNAIRMAKENAKHIAKTLVDHEINFDAPDDPNSIFDINNNRSSGERYFANPHINELIKKLEGTKGVHDGFDMHNPREVERPFQKKKVITSRDAASGEKKKVNIPVDDVKNVKYTDGFVFPSRDVIDGMIDRYIKALGHGFIKYEDSDMKYQDNNPKIPESERKELDAFWKTTDMKDNMTKDVLDEFLFKRAKRYLEKEWEKDHPDVPYKHGQEPADKTNKEKLRLDSIELAKQWAQEVFDAQKIKSPKHPVHGIRDAVPHRGHFNDLNLLYRTSHVRRIPYSIKKSGIELWTNEPQVEEIKIPVLPKGHFVKMLEPYELEIIDKIEEKRKEDPSAGLEDILEPNELAIYNNIFRGNHKDLLRGNHFDYARKDHPEEEGGRYRPIHIKSDHLLGAEASQGTDHKAIGGFSPSRETPAKKFLGKYNVEADLDADGKTKGFKGVDNEEYRKKVQAMFVDNSLGKDVREIIKDGILKKLSQKKKQETFDLTLERGLLRMVLDELIEIGFMNVMNNLSIPDIERNPKIIEKLVEKMVENIEQQNIGRGTRRKRSGFGVFDQSFSDIGNLHKFADELVCKTDFQKRGMKTGNCVFPYRLDNILKSAADTAIDASIMAITQDLNLKSKTKDDTKDYDTVQDKEAYVAEYIKVFRYGLVTLSMLYFQKMVNDNPDSNESDHDNFEEKAKEAAQDFIMKSMESSSGSINVAASIVKKEINRLYNSVPHPTKDGEVANTTPAQPEQGEGAPSVNVEDMLEKVQAELDSKPLNYDAIINSHRVSLNPAVLDSLKRKVIKDIEKQKHFASQMLLITHMNPLYFTNEELSQRKSFILDEKNKNYFLKYKDKYAVVLQKIEKELQRRASGGY
jgi:hypothetical protein